MRALTIPDVLTACLIAAIAGAIAGGNTAVGLLFLCFLGGLYLSLRLTRGRSVVLRAGIVVAAFALPLLVTLAITLT
jgi:hypothetical protein